jgi:1-pyrroline-5-carboxylate dehydrogenase
VRAHCLSDGRRAYRRFSSLVLPNITNEPFLHYAPGSAERSKVLAACKSAREECPEIPLVINGRAVRTGDIGHQVALQHPQAHSANAHSGDAQ